MIIMVILRGARRLVSWLVLKLRSPAAALPTRALSWVVGGAILTASSGLLAADRDLPADVDFLRDARPILAAQCFACHGPDANTREADLRLDVRDSATESEAIVPGDVQASELVRRINSDDEDEVMPPPASNTQLSAEQKQVLERWIAQGAEYSQHWAFTPPRRPALPVVSNTAWPRTDIDLFVLARLEREELTRSPEADRRALIRRLSLDLTGLPPTPAEVRSFVDDRSEGAYEQVVDRLLASPRYGERMAQHWLDLARYGDSDGYHDDT
ncbi:DUF1549 domain-containing protein, partial [Pirellulales bacterium]|nr:DUF1549 domain-containing protein [Pirellulales bacterium]